MVCVQLIVSAVVKFLCVQCSTDCGWRSSQQLDSSDCSWIRTAPNPTGLASAITFVGAFLSKCASFTASSSLSVLNAAICSLPNTNGMSLRVNLLSWSLFVAYCGMNLDQWFTSPKKLRSSCTVSGCLASTTALTRSSVGPMSFVSTRYPKNSSSVRPI